MGGLYDSAPLRVAGAVAEAGMEVFDAVLLPLEAHYRDAATVEIRMSRPGEVVVERRGQGKTQVPDAELTIAAVEGICRSLANVNGLEFHPDNAPKVSCVLPGGHRFECLVGASAQSGLSLAIRCKHPFVPSWAEIGAEGEIEAWLKGAVAEGRSVVISGATNTGKTTLMNMLLAGLPDERRVIAVEDTPELHLDRFWDGVGLLSAREAAEGSGMVDWRQLYNHVVRITPDHVVFGEISTRNAFAALAALNSGISGFMCTIHAASARQAVERKFEQNVAWSGETMPKVPEYLRELVDVVVQISRDADGWRRVKEILEPRGGRYFVSEGKIAPQGTVVALPAPEKAEEELAATHDDGREKEVSDGIPASRIARALTGTGKTVAADAGDDVPVRAVPPERERRADSSGTRT